MATRGIGIDEVETAIEKGNVSLPTGTLYGKNQAFIVQASGQLMKAADYRPLIVSYKQGRPVRLSEIGRVIDKRSKRQNRKLVQQYAGHRARDSTPAGREPVEVVNKIRQMLPSFRSQIPAAVSLDILYDRSNRFVNRFTMCSLRCCSRLALW